MSGPLKILGKEQIRPRFYVQTGSMYDNPWGVPESEIREMEASLPPEMVAQAIYGMYVEASGLIFSNTLLNTLFVGQEIKCEEYHHPAYPFRFGRRSYDSLHADRAGYSFVAGVDLARRNDYTVIMVFDATHVPHKPAEMVYYRRLNRVTWDTIYAAIARVSAGLRCEVMVDSTGMGGDVVLDELDNRFYCPHCDAAVPFSLTEGSYFCPQCDKQGDPIQVAGYNFSGRRKEQLVTRLQDALGYGKSLRPKAGLLRMPHIAQVADEMTFYRLDDKDLSTDTVMALGLVAIQLEFDEVGGSVGSVHGDY